MTGGLKFHPQNVAFLLQFPESQDLQLSSLYGQKYSKHKKNPGFLSMSFDFSKAKPLVLWEGFWAIVKLPDAEEGVDVYRFWEAATNVCEGRRLSSLKMAV
jgi:hypothetical protein